MRCAIKKGQTRLDSKTHGERKKTARGFCADFARFGSAGDQSNFRGILPEKEVLPRFYRVGPRRVLRHYCYTGVSFGQTLKLSRQWPDDAGWLCFLYQARPLVLFIIMCTCWSYSFGVFSLAFLCSATWFAGDFLCSLGIETALFLLTVVPFYRGIVVKFAFAIENIRACDENWNKYILLTSGLNLVTLAVLHNVLLAESGSIMKICLLLLLLLSTFVANFTLYRIVLDSIKIQHLEKTAASDPLTGLGNRTGLLDHLEALLAGAAPFSVLFMDLD